MGRTVKAPNFVSRWLDEAKLYFLEPQQRRSFAQWGFRFRKAHRLEGERRWAGPECCGGALFCSQHFCWKDSLAEYFLGEFSGSHVLQMEFSLLRYPGGLWFLYTCTCWQKLREFKMTLLNMWGCKNLAFYLHCLDFLLTSASSYYFMQWQNKYAFFASGYKRLMVIILVLCIYFYSIY